MKSKHADLTKLSLDVPQEIAKQLKGSDAFLTLLHMPGKVFRVVRGRKTVQVKLGTNSYFIKQHFGVGWVEILKNLLTFKKPIISARTEKLAIEKLAQIGIATTPFVAFGEQGCNPASRQSFLMTKDLGDIVSLEDLSADWKNNPPSAKFKRKLIIAVAKLAKKLHENGMCHRDFYICHLCIHQKNLTAALNNNAEIELYLIDLHRMFIQEKPSSKNSFKDIAALYFSTMDLDLGANDYLRFMHYYDAHTSSIFWHQVQMRAKKLYIKFNSKKFQKKLMAEKASLKD